MKYITILLVSLGLFTACQAYDSAPGYHSGGESGKGGSMARFTISGDYLYTVDNNTLRTFNVSDAANPEYLSGKDNHLDFGVETVFTMDTLLFIGSQTGMYIYNITRPDFPQKMALASHITSCDPVVASGNYAYVTLNSENFWCGRSSNQLLIYDITDPYNPGLLHTETGFTHPRGLGIDGKKLFICDKGLKVYDVSNPERPVWIDDLSHIPEAKDIDAYDVIPLNGLLLLTGADGLYQFNYEGEKLAYVSKIEVSSDK